MTTWKLGDHTVNRIGFGAMRLDPATGVAVLRRAVELGVDHFDTAQFYGAANELIRTALSPYRSELLIATKVGPGTAPERGFYYAANATELRAQVDDNLRVLAVDSLDLVNLRVPDNSGSLADHFAVLAALRDAGVIRHLGVSNVRAEQLEEALTIAPVVCVQNYYSVDERADDPLIDLCAERGIAYVPFSSIVGASSAAVDAIAEARGASSHQVRLAWTLQRSPNILGIPGTGKIPHLEQNVAAGAIQLTPEELTTLTD
ncbi:aldo/keto reductase [Kribbella antibiotica]|uniref:Aldo/keto reductase n=1 Tax=Kribbella antibiotica TaxID=190195 RepID=A0A4R4ZEA2_9ACTN|nr:aldo/keto reductase [Kribbella antibiotica]TDD56376.1 aldo/keto reductase [Kribbella antibiotica]